LQIQQPAIRKTTNQINKLQVVQGRLRTLERLIDYYGKPQAIRLDNGPEMTSQQFMDWAQTQDIYIRYIQPGKPNQNAFIERFNRTYRDEVLDAHLFDNIR